MLACLCKYTRVRGCARHVCPCVCRSLSLSATLFVSVIYAHVNLRGHFGSRPRRLSGWFRPTRLAGGALGCNGSPSVPSPALIAAAPTWRRWRRPARRTSARPSSFTARLRRGGTLGRLPHGSSTTSSGQPWAGKWLAHLPTAARRGGDYSEVLGKRTRPAGRRNIGSPLRRILRVTRQLRQRRRQPRRWVLRSAPLRLCGSREVCLESSYEKRWDDYNGNATYADADALGERWNPLDRQLQHFAFPSLNNGERPLPRSRDFAFGEHGGRWRRSLVTACRPRKPLLALKGRGGDGLCGFLLELHDEPSRGGCRGKIWLPLCNCRDDIKRPAHAAVLLPIDRCGTL